MVNLDYPKLPYTAFARLSSYLLDIRASHAHYIRKITCIIPVTLIHSYAS